jgi:hypothetical protein
MKTNDTPKEIPVPHPNEPDKSNPTKPDQDNDPTPKREHNDPTKKQEPNQPTRINPRPGMDQDCFVGA